MTRNRPDKLGMTYLDPKPRLATLKGIRKAQKFRDELYGEGKKKVTLPTFSFTNKEGKVL